MSDPLALAAALARQAALAAPTRLTPLTGGRNNRVFRVDAATGPPVVLKLYSDDDRDRLGHEWAFLTYAWNRGLRAAPQPLARDLQARAALLSFLPGRKLAAGELTGAHVDAALDFVLALNAPAREPRNVPDAAEACFSLADHLATVERRLARLPAAGDGADGVRGRAAAFVEQRLAPRWRQVRARIERAMAATGLSAGSPIAQSAVCVSPSDFGFQNALVEAGTVAFLDFEYAGRDDPAKLACDFFCQPDVPVPMAMHDRFVRRLVDGLKLQPADEARCRLLLDAYRVKWICIILNDFVAVDAERRRFAGHDTGEGKLAAQLAMAEQKLLQIGDPPEGPPHGLS